MNPRAGVATAIALTSTSSQLVRGGTLQVSASLSDALGNTVAPTQQIVWRSSNTALATVDQNGLVSAIAGDPTQLQTGGAVVITAHYPWAGAPSSGATISAAARLVVTVPAAVSAFVPRDPSVTLLQATNSTGACGRGGSGWKNIPAYLEN